MPAAILDLDKCQAAKLCTPSESCYLIGLYKLKSIIKQSLYSLSILPCHIHEIPPDYNDDLLKINTSHWRGLVLLRAQSIDTPTIFYLWINTTTSCGIPFQLIMTINGRRIWWENVHMVWIIYILSYIKDLE